MAGELPRFHRGEPVIVTRPCLGVPAFSVGVVTKIYTATPPLYLVSFGAPLQAGPLPEAVLAFFKLTDAPG